MNNKQRVFIDREGKELMVEVKGKKISFWLQVNPARFITIAKPTEEGKIIDVNYIPTEELSKEFQFTKETWEELITYLQETAQYLWEDFEPKEKTTFRSDYIESFDSEFNSEAMLGYHRKGPNDWHLFVKGAFQPHEGKELVKGYFFTKQKLASFLFDVERTEAQAVNLVV